ncbi:hypothetical protein G6F56_014171 [Rhizopus delemar]|nr:hypothetical protein G6F56_014171 [Rhizopus delemar]
MANNTQEQIALASSNIGSSYTPGYRPKLIEFYGYEGEDFRHFQEILDSHYAAECLQIVGFETFWRHIGDITCLHLKIIAERWRQDGDKMET